MKVGIMQPYLFPYIGYFQLINYVDQWVVFDDTQYISKGWVNRNRILHPDVKKEWQYFTVPVKKHTRECRIKEIEINSNVQWKQELLGKLSHYKKAPFYQQTIEFINDCLNFDNDNLTQFSINSLQRSCDYLGIPFKYSVFSEMSINTDNVQHAGQWALSIADQIGATDYINPASGYTLFKEEEFLEKNIQLRFLQSNTNAYHQRREPFIPSLSIIDVMMWNDKDKIQEMLRAFDIVKHSQCSDHLY